MSPIMTPDDSRILRWKSYSDEYKEMCFEAWYRAGCPASMAGLMSVLPEDENGHRPTKEVVKRWKSENGWTTRADILNARVANEMENELVEERKAMLKRHTKAATKLQEIGMTYLENSGLDSDATALRAVLEGAQLERESRGLSEALSKILKMTDDQLATEVQALLSRARPSETLESDEILKIDENENSAPPAEEEFEEENADSDDSDDQ